MKTSSALILAALVVQVASYCNVSQVVEGIRSRRTPVRGANLGAWFVLEGWMTPWLWSNNNCDPNSVKGQWQFEQCVQQQGGNIGSVLEAHWSSFVTETDFQNMANSGVNAIRLPIGWWMIYDPEGGANNAHLNYYVTPSAYTVGGLKYMDMAFDWAEKYGIAIFIDMHAAPGSQNGNDNSSPSNSGQEYWDKYPANQGETVDSIVLYAQRYANRSALVGFCLLNEPIVDIPTLQAYYEKAYGAILQVINPTVIVINPLISPPQSGTEPEWVSFMDYDNVWMSLHYYYCFGGPWDQNAQAIIEYAQNERAQGITYYNSVNTKPMIVDEWSACGVSDYDASLNGQFVQAQLSGYVNAAGGYTFWAWSNPSDGNVWSLQTALSSGWINSNQMAATC
eukprot:TRINITY_DN2429_c0_g1_i1.p1 TRINITY_DN2429_c0_g1~~TRINITY_DN2429_c0_g1_i1.p1  ORF type:complete len:412 (-),score=100.49 TRINITY_DN2429_c0_g1_i1:47-1228(-)